MNSIRGTKTCFVQHWHQRKAGRSRPTIVFLFLQDSWCLHQQNAQMPSIPRVCPHTNASLRLPHPRDSFKEFDLLQPHKGRMNLQVRAQHCTRHHKDRTFQRGPNTHSLKYKQRYPEVRSGETGAESKFIHWSRHRGH